MIADAERLGPAAGGPLRLTALVQAASPITVTSPEPGTPARWGDA